MRYNLSMDTKELFIYLKATFNVDTDTRFMTFDEFQDYYDEYTDFHDEFESSIEEMGEINSSLIESIQDVENISDSASLSISTKLSKIKALLEDISDLVKSGAEKISDEDNFDVVIADGLSSTLSELKTFLEEYPGFKKKNLQFICDYVSCLLIEENMKGIKDKPGILTAKNIKEIVDEIDMPAYFGYCTQGILMKIAHENELAFIVIPFGAKVRNGDKQLDLFGDTHISTLFEWGNSFVEILGTIDNPHILYKQDNDVIPLDEIYTREELMATKEA